MTEDVEMEAPVGQLPVCLVSGSETALMRAVVRRIDEFGWRPVGVDAIDEIETVTGSILGCFIERSPLQESFLPSDELPPDLWRRAIDISLIHPVTVCQAAARRMLKAGEGAIVIVSSALAQEGMAERASLCATDAALRGFVQAAAIEWGARGVRVNLLDLGASPVADDPALQARIQDRMPLEIPDIDCAAEAAMFLLAAASHGMTGSSLPVDGGLRTGFLNRWRGADFASAALLERGSYAPILSGAIQ
jgi:NAD(P)-dependent dehydrogenase (short-subunit alcohol dehydrogenase family)